MTLTIKSITQKRFCSRCGNNFTTNQHERDVCQKCERQRYCVICAKRFEIGWRNTSTCSNECSNKLNIKQKEFTICQHCNKTIKDGSNYIKKSDSDIHILCEYEHMKNEIKINIDSIGNRRESIEDCKKEIEDMEKEIEVQKKDLEKLAKEYPTEIIGDIL